MTDLPTLKIYLASSWRNKNQPAVLDVLRRAGHEVYDFRNPQEIHTGDPRPRGDFHWSDIDPNWKQWTSREFRAALDHPIADEGYRADFEAMLWANCFVLLNPSGRSAHLEAGWATGRKKPTAILLGDGEPELMYKQADEVLCTTDELLDWCQGVRIQLGECYSDVSPSAEHGVIVPLRELPEEPVKVWEGDGASIEVGPDGQRRVSLPRDHSVIVLTPDGGSYVLVCAPDKDEMLNASAERVLAAIAAFKAQDEERP